MIKYSKIPSNYSLALRGKRPRAQGAGVLGTGSFVEIRGGKLAACGSAISPPMSIRRSISQYACTRGDRVEFIELSRSTKAKQQDETNIRVTKRLTFSIVDAFEVVCDSSALRQCLRQTASMLVWVRKDRWLSRGIAAADDVFGWPKASTRASTSICGHSDAEADLCHPLIHAISPVFHLAYVFDSAFRTRTWNEILKLDD